MTVEIRPLKRHEAPRYRAFTFPAYRRLLSLEPAVLYPEESDARHVLPLGFSAAAGGDVSGLVLGAIPETRDQRLPELLSIYVHPGARRQGIADALLERLEEEVRKQGFAALETVFMTGRPGIEAFEGLLQKRRWSPPTARMIVLKFTVEEAMRTSWYQRYRRRTELEFFPWKELPPEELAELRESQEEKAWIAEDLVPWKYDQSGFEEVSSIGIRLGGQVVGWVLNHRLNADTVRFTCSFIRRDLSRRGRIVPAYSESIRRLSETPFGRCTLTVPLHHREMVAFVKRRCAPWAYFLGETRESVKRLQ